MVQDVPLALPRLPWACISANSTVIMPSWEDGCLTILLCNPWQQRHCHHILPPILRQDVVTSCVLITSAKQQIPGNLISKPRSLNAL